MGCGWVGVYEDQRLGFGNAWNVAIEAGGVLVGDDVTIQLDVSLIRA